jgi:hypothetical protein
MTDTLYQIVDWDNHYENAKSRTIEHTSWCPIPNKQDGLSYSRLMTQKDAAAIYGAFVAVILVASKQAMPREGYLTDTGSIDGIPHTPADLALMTKLPEKTIEAMLIFCTSVSIGWIGAYERNGTEWTPQGHNGDTAVPRKKEQKEQNRKKEIGRNLSEMEKKRIKYDGEITQQMIDIGKLFLRRPTTKWTIYEHEALEQVGGIEPLDMWCLFQYYDDEDIPKESDYRRRSVGTFLNNITGEIDRAKEYCRQKRLLRAIPKEVEEAQAEWEEKQ